MEYYYLENGEQCGPVNIESLKNKNINAKTLVWNINLEEWTEAKNIIELREIIKISPPPIPIKQQKSIKVQAEVSKKKENFFTPEREKIIAKETKKNYKLFKYAIYIGVASFIWLVYLNEGFAHKIIQFKLERDMNNKVEYYEGQARIDFEENRQALKSESASLGYRPYFHFNTRTALEYHSSEFYDTLKKSIYLALIISFFSFIVLIFGRYLIKSAKWIDKKAID